MISIIIPTYNEETNIEAAIKHIKEYSDSGDIEIIITDGGSKDNTVAIAKSYGCLVVNGIKGRGNQLNAGAVVAKGNILLFLHADTFLPVNFIEIINDAFRKNRDPYYWGRFDVKLTGNHLLFRVVEKMISLRSKITGIATGDQAIFIDKPTFSIVNGFKDIPLMEDVDITRRLKRLSPPICLKQCVITSSRRWEDKGIIKTILLMWMLRFLFFIRVNPKHLLRLY